MARAAKIERPPPAVYELQSVPALNRPAEQLRRDICDYVDYMAKANRKPTHIRLRASQFDQLCKAINARLDKTTAPPPIGFDVHRHSRGAADAARGVQ